MASKLVAAPEGRQLRDVNNGSVINLATLDTRSLSISFTPSAPVGSLRVQHNGGDRMENFAPYSLAGDADGSFNPADLHVGTHTVTITPYPRPNLNGTPGQSTIITFEVVDISSTNPALLTQEGSDHAVAFNAATFVREPFPLFTQQNFSSDKRTRVLLFVTDFPALNSDTMSEAVVLAENATIGSIPLPIEYVVKVPSFDWLTQIEVVLPADSLQNAGDMWVTVSFRGASTNQARLRIKQATVSSNEPSLMNLFRDWVVPDMRFLWPLSALRQNG